jgi:protein-L-isoaspartate(D-aspartate) O-methyltransferase
MPEIDRSAARRRMVETQIVPRGIRDPRVLAAMREVPRERFVPPGWQESAYADAALPIEAGQTISQPSTVAWMLEAARIPKGGRVLEVGCGSGYAAAVLARIVGDQGAVFAIERHAALAEQARRRFAEPGLGPIEVRCGDGTLGWPEAAPFDAIVVSAGGPEVPATLLSQVRVGGRLVMPVGRDQRSQELVVVERRGASEWHRESLGRVQFVPLIGREAWPEEAPRTVPEARSG